MILYNQENKQRKQWMFILTDLRCFCSYLFWWIIFNPSTILLSEVTDMHKAEIADENEELKHHIQCYDSKFLRAHNRLSKLQQEYAASKQYLPPKRYRLLKEMIETVVEDSKLKPDWTGLNQSEQVVCVLMFDFNLSWSNCSFKKELQSTSGPFLSSFISLVTIQILAK